MKWSTGARLGHVEARELRAGCAAAQANLERAGASALLRFMVDVFFMYISFSRREDGAILSACALRRGGGYADSVHRSIPYWGIECRVSELRMATGQRARRKRRGEEVVPTPGYTLVLA